MWRQLYEQDSDGSSIDAVLRSKFGCELYMRTRDLVVLPSPLSNSPLHCITQWAALAVLGHQLWPSKVRSLHVPPVPSPSIHHPCSPGTELETWRCPGCFDWQEGRWVRDVMVAVVIIVACRCCGGCQQVRGHWVCGKKWRYEMDSLP